MKVSTSLILIIVSVLVAMTHAGMKEKLMKKAARPLMYAAAAGGALGLGYGYLVSKDDHHEGGNTHIYNYASHGHKSDVKIINIPPKHYK